MRRQAVVHVELCSEIPAIVIVIDGSPSAFRTFTLARDIRRVRRFQMRKILTAATAALTLAGALAATTAPVQAQTRGHGGGFHGGSFHGGGFHGGGFHGGGYRGYGYGVGAGLAGFALGAAIASPYYGYGYGPYYGYNNGYGYG